MSWSQLGLFAGQYISGGDVTPENFPPESPGDVRPVREYRFDRNIQGLEALERLRKEGLEIARPRATSEYLEDNPDLQKQFSVIGAGVWQPRPGKILMVQFTRHSRSRGAVYTTNARDLIFEGVVFLVSPVAGA